MMSKWAAYSVASRTHKCNDDMHDTDMCLDQILSASDLGESMFGITVVVTKACFQEGPKSKYILKRLRD